MKKRRLGLQAKFIGLILLLLTVIFTVIAVVLIHVDTTSLRKDLQDRSKAFATLATTPIGNTYVTYHNSGTYLIGKQIATFQALDPTIANVSIVDLDGKVLFSTQSIGPPIAAHDASSFDPIYKFKGSTISQIIYPFISSNGSHSYAIVYDISSTEINNAVRSLANSILIDSVIGLLVSGAVMSILVSRLFLRPIKQLRDRAMIIASGKYSEQIPHWRKDEIGDLASSVNQMAESLKADIQKLKEVDEIKSEFMMIASHNLRTPLTIINGYIDMAKSWALSSELRAMLQSIEANSQRLGIFAEDLLTMSNIEAGKPVFNMEKATVTKMLSHAVEEFGTLAGEKQRHFKANITAGDVELIASPMHLRSAIWNLLDNALKFTEVDGQIELAIQKVGDNVQISVADNGPGISQEEKGKLFTKFHRGTSTLNYNYEGTGIGLYITRQIITAHHGTITVDSTPGMGSTFTIILPTAAAAEAQSPSEPPATTATQPTPATSQPVATSTEAAPAPAAPATPDSTAGGAPERSTDSDKDKPAVTPDETKEVPVGNGTSATTVETEAPAQVQEAAAPPEKDEPKTS